MSKQIHIDSVKEFETDSDFYDYINETLATDPSASLSFRGLVLKNLEREDLLLKVSRVDRMLSIMGCKYSNLSFEHWDKAPEYIKIVGCSEVEDISNIFYQSQTNHVKSFYISNNEKLNSISIKLPTSANVIIEENPELKTLGEFYYETLSHCQGRFYISNNPKLSNISNFLNMNLLSVDVNIDDISSKNIDINQINKLKGLNFLSSGVITSPLADGSWL